MKTQNHTMGSQNPFSDPFASHQVVKQKKKFNFSVDYSILKEFPSTLRFSKEKYPNSISWLYNGPKLKIIFYV